MQPYAELLYYTQLNPNTIGKKGIRDKFGLKEPEDLISFSGSYDYGEENAKKWNLPSKSGDHRIVRYIKAGHESMLEMVDAVFFVTCSRTVSHEFVRHRAGMSYQQESQRFVKYDDKSSIELFYMPPEAATGDIAIEIDGDVVSPEDVLLHVYDEALLSYKRLREAGVAPQIARYALPNATRTNLIVKGNLRSWRHICKLRMDRSAQPEMQVVVGQIYEQLLDLFPNAMHGVLDGERGTR